MLGTPTSPDLTLANLLSQIDIRDILHYKRSSFESKFCHFKEQITNPDGKMQHQPEGREYEDFKEETETEYESETDEVQEELVLTKRKLREEEAKNELLRQEVEDLKELVDLYVGEARTKEALDEEWRELNLEAEVCRKIGEISTLENTVEELKKAVSGRDQEILKKNQKIKDLENKLDYFRSNCKTDTTGYYE